MKSKPLGRPPGSKNKPKVKELVQATMMPWPKVAGPSDLVMLISEYGGRERVAQDFQISLELLDKWASGELEIPKTVMLSIFWQGPRGMNLAFVESHWTNQFNCHRARVAEEKALLLELAVKDIAVELGFEHPALLPVRKLLGVATA